MDHNHPSEAVLGTLTSVAGLASVDNSQPGVSFPETASLDNTLPNGYFLGIEKTPPNILFGKLSSSRLCSSLSSFTPSGTLPRPWRRTGGAWRGF